MSPHSETDTLLSWPQSTGGRATCSLSGSRPRRRDEFARRDELGRRERDRDRDRDEFVVPRRAGSTLGTGSRRAPPYDLTFRPNSAILYHPPPLRWKQNKNKFDFVIEVSAAECNQCKSMNTIKFWVRDCCNKISNSIWKLDHINWMITLSRFLLPDNQWILL
jgi:hypothetical protein